MGKKSNDVDFYEASLIQSPAKGLFMLIPFILSFTIGGYFCGTSDALEIIKWEAVLLVFAIAALPIGLYVFRKFSAGTFIPTTVIGLLAVSLFVWTLTYFKVYKFNFVCVIIAIVVLAVISYVIKPLRENLIKKLDEPMFIEQLALEETIFVIFLTILCYFKGFNPIINGQEKFMDYGFIMSMLRNPNLPANDIWLSGYSINYYYFGQFIWALVIKVTGISPAIGYNLALCSAIALPFSLAFSAGFFLVESSETFGAHKSLLRRYLTGILAAFMTIVFGNSHSFFYDENSVGNHLLNFLGNHGVTVGKTTEYFYPDSTRYIGHNPDITVYDDMGSVVVPGDFTIEEFPFYSFIVGDLHAHVISMIIVLLIVTIAIALITNIVSSSPVDRNAKIGFGNLSLDNGTIKTEFKNVITIETVFIAVLLGIAQMTNYWDFLIYFIFSSMLLLVVNTRKSRDFASLSGTCFFIFNVAMILASYLALSSSVVTHCVVQLIVLIISYIFLNISPCALSRTSFGMSFMFTVAHFVALPFNFNFDMISNKLGKTIHHSSPFQLAILWGTHILIGIVFMLFVIFTKNYKESHSEEVDEADINGIPNGGFSNPVAGFIGRRNLADVLVCGTFVVSILLLIAPEIFYVRDIYTGGHLRANTMFKFTFAAFIMLSIVAAYGLIRLFWLINKKGVFSASAFIIGSVLAFTILIPAHFTGIALSQRNGEMKKENYLGLDGTKYLKDSWYSQYSYIEGYDSLNTYYEAIEWLNENVKGSHVICETFGESYTDYNIVSAYTGLPTVCGWETHEWLWRYHGIVNPETDLIEPDPERDPWDLYLNPRHYDIEAFYTTADPEYIQYIIDKYNIEYIVLGNIEYYRYNLDNTYTFQQVGEVVFSSGNLNIFKVTPSGMKPPEVGV